MKTGLFLALALASKCSAHASLRQTASRAVRLPQLPCIVLLCFSCETSAQGVAEPLDRGRRRDSACFEPLRQDSRGGFRVEVRGFSQANGSIEATRGSRKN